MLSSRTAGGGGDDQVGFAAARSMDMLLLVVVTALLALPGMASSANVALSDIPSKSETIDVVMRMSVFDNSNNPVGSISTYNPTLYFDSSGPNFEANNDQTHRAYVNNASDGKTLNTAYTVYNYDPTASTGRQCTSWSAPSYAQLLCRYPAMAFFAYPVAVDGTSVLQSLTPGNVCSAYTDADSVGAWNCSADCVDNKRVTLTALCMDSSQNAVAVISLTTGYSNGSSILRVYESLSVTATENTVDAGSVFSCSSFQTSSACTLQSFTAGKLHLCRDTAADAGSVVYNVVSMVLCHIHMLCTYYAFNLDAVSLATTSFPAIPSGSTSLPEPPSTGGERKSHTGVIIWIIAGVLIVLAAAIGVIILCCRKSRAKRKQSSDEPTVKPFVPAPSIVPPPPPFDPGTSGYTIERSYPRDASQMDMGFNDLVAATNNFDPYYKIGEGGYGHVYCAHFSDGSKLAVKKIELNAANLQLAEREVQAEVDTMSQLDHPNIVRLYTCVQRGSTILLVLEYVEGGTLEDRLQDTSHPLTWVQRVRIAIGTARALSYLHGRCIVHRDVRPANLLLDRYTQPKLADFGLAKTANLHHLAALNKQTRVLGAAGYIAPEYASSGKSSFKSDCYSFGVVLMQLLTGRQVIDNTRPPAEMTLARHMAHLIDRPEEVVKLMDPLLSSSVAQQEFIQVASLAVRCSQHTELMRPTAVELLQELEALLPMNNSLSNLNDYK